MLSSYKKRGVSTFQNMNKAPIGTNGNFAPLQLLIKGWNSDVDMMETRLFFFEYFEYVDKDFQSSTLCMYLKH